MVTDIFLCFFVIFQMLRGASRGFWLSLFDPICMILATITAYFYFKMTDNIPVALLIGIIGPIFLYSIVKAFILFFMTTEEKKKSPSTLSRILGLLITTAWGLIFILPILIIMTLFPPMNPLLKSITGDVNRSVIISSLNKPLQEKFMKSTNDQETLALPDVHINAQAFADDPRIKEIYEDPQIKQAIEEKNFLALMNNPKIVKLAQDPEFIQKVLLELKRKKEDGVDAPQ